MSSVRKQNKRLRRHRTIRSPRWAELWQIPLFCLGMTSCLVMLWLHFSQESKSQLTVAQYEATLETLDHANMSRLRELTQSIQASGQSGELSDADQKYLQACLLLEEAKQRHPLPASSADALTAYTRAKVAFEQLLERDRSYLQFRLPYRIALANLGSAAVTSHHLDVLEQTLESNFTDRQAGYQLIARLRLQLSPPDYAGALRSIDLLLSILDAKTQNPHRLQKAEILAQLQRWADINKAIAGIAPEALEYPAALQWQALAAFQQKQWGEAARLWALVAPRDLGPRALLYYGLCQQQLKNSIEAKRLWERLWHEHLHSPEALSAQCNLSELAMEQARWHDAAMSLIAILTTHESKSLPTAYLTLDEFREKANTVSDRLTQLHRWDDLQQLGQAALRWPFGGRADQWLCQAWHAKAVATSAANSTAGQSRAAYLLSADHAWKAAQHMPGSEKARLLLQAGQDALQAKAYQQAQRALGELLTLNPESAMKPVVLIGLAEALHEQKKHVLAMDRLHEALRIPGNHEAQARLRLAQLLLLEDKQNQEAGKQLEQAAALVSRPESGPDARTACHRWAAYLYNAVVENKSNQTLQAIDACEKALKSASPHPEAAQTRYLLAELLLAEARPRPSIVLAHTDQQILRKQTALLWQACQCFQAAADELTQADTIIYSTKNKDSFIRFARFGQAECWFALGQFREYAPQVVPSSDVCWQRAAELYQSLSDASANRVDSLHAYLRLSWCQQKRGLFAEMGETLRDARQQLHEMKDDELLAPSRFASLNRSEWEAWLRKSDDIVRGQP